MFKIKVHTPIVELDGDEMARVMWCWIKESLIFPYLELSLKYYDLNLNERNKTQDSITTEAALAIKKYGVGIKCATITPTLERMQEYNLQKLYPSPNGTIRNIIGGTVFRTPILCDNIPRYINNWKKPITIARHAFGDQYAAKEIEISANTSAKLVIMQDNFIKQEIDIYNFESPGILMAIYNCELSITEFAHACFQYALKENLPLFFTSKNTILKVYDTKFVEIFNDLYVHHYEALFLRQGLNYSHRLIDDMVAYAIKSEGGFIWACKNYDGDVQSDMVAQGFGSLGLMSSILINAQGDIVEAEAAHGTVTRHYREYLKGNKTSTNPIASIFAWTKGLKYRAKFDKNRELEEFSERLELACKMAINKGYLTKDLALLSGSQNYVDTETFINEVKVILEYL